MNSSTIRLPPVPDWTFPLMYQAIGRGIRHTAVVHDSLETEEMGNPFLYNIGSDLINDNVMIQQNNQPDAQPMYMIAADIHELRDQLYPNGIPAELLQEQKGA